MPRAAIAAVVAALVAIANADNARAGQPPSPLPAAQAVAAVPDRDFASDIAAAKELRRRGRGRDAVALLESDHKLAPHNRDVTVALAETYSSLGQQGRAIALLDALIAALPDDVDARILLAQAYSFNHDYAAAEQQYGVALKSAPADEDAIVGLGQTLSFEGRYADAKAQFRRVLARDPQNSDARVGLAGAEAFDGDYRAARADYEAVLRTQPDNTDALVGLATVQYWLGNVPAAIALNDRALAIDPGDSDARDLQHQLMVKRAPQIISSVTTAHSNDGNSYDYQLSERYYTTPTLSFGLVQELYQISGVGTDDGGNPAVVTVQAHRVGIVATYQGPNQFGADLRIVGSKFGGVPSVTDSVFTLSGAHDDWSYGLGTSIGGVDGSIAANGGQTAPGQQSAAVRITAIFANAGYTRRGTGINATAQTAQYNDGNRFHEFTADISHVFGIGAYNSITPDIGERTAGFSNTYTNPSVAFAPGYYNYVSQRDETLSVTAERQLNPRFSAGLIGTLGSRRTIVLTYPPVGRPVPATPGALPFQRLAPYLDYEGDRFSLRAAYYDDHYSGDYTLVQPFAANTLDVTFSIRLP